MRILFLSLLLFLFSCSNLTTSGDLLRSPASVDELGLTGGLSKLMEYEQLLIDRTVDDSRIMAPTIQAQQNDFRPEARRWFALKSVWIPESELREFQLTETLNEYPLIRDHFIKKEKGKRFYRLLIHPESEKFYADILSKYVSEEEFEATATSSSRTVLVRKKGEDGALFFAKLSLAVELGGVVRTIPKGEVSRSVGHSSFFNQVKMEDGHFKVIREPFSIIPNGWDRGGMIVREIPANLSKKGVELVPMFSLYANLDGGETLIEQLAHINKMELQEFIELKILKPFMSEWAKWAFEHRVVMEAHAQNFLIEIKNGIPTGNFYLRDLGGFSVNLDHYSVIKRTLPSIDSVNEEYHQKFYRDAISDSIGTYFDGGFLYNLDRLLQKRDPAYQKYSVNQKAQRILLDELEKVAGKAISRKSRYITTDAREFGSSLPEILEKLRKPTKESCLGLLNHFLPTNW